MPPPTEIETSVLVGGIHTLSPDEEGGADMTEKKVGEQGNDGSPDQELWG